VQLRIAQTLADFDEPGQRPEALVLASCCRVCLTAAAGITVVTVLPATSRVNDHVGP
jgi:hypothetical protein